MDLEGKLGGGRRLHESKRHGLREQLERGMLGPIGFPYLIVNDAMMSSRSKEYYIVNDIFKHWSLTIVNKKTKIYTLEIAPVCVRAKR